MTSVRQRILGVFRDRMDLREIASKPLVVLSLVLYIFSTQTTHVSVLEEVNFLAMISEYPITYWISIIVILFTVCISKGKMIYLELSLLFVYLVNTPLLVESNVRIPSAYWPLGLAGQINKAGTMVNTTSSGPYTYFPGYVFLASVISQIIGVPLDVLLIILSIIVGLTLLWNVIILNRFLLANWQVSGHLRSRLLIFSALLFIAGSWVNIMYFHPMSVALLLFILLLNIACKYQFLRPSSRPSSFIVVIFLYFSIVITHPLIPLFILSFAFLYYIVSFVLKNRNMDITQPLLFAILYMVWVFFQASSFVKNNILEVVQSINDFAGLFSRASLARGAFARSIDYSIVFWIRVGLMVAILGLAIAGLLKIFVEQRRKTASEKDSSKTVFVLVLAYVFGAVPLLLFPYGGEIFIRVFYVLLPFLIFLVALALGRSKRAVVVSISILLLMMPIASIGDESTVLVSDYEIKGASFFQAHAPTDSRYLYEFPSLIFYFDVYGPPNFKEYVRVAKLRFNQTYPLSLVNSSDWNYFLDTQATRNYYTWYLGFDLGEKIINSTLLNKIYDNGDFRIFEET